MKKTITFSLALALLFACAAPAGAVKYEPDAPKSPPPVNYTEAQAMYEINEAIRLGLAPAELRGNYDRAATRAELTETVLTAIAARFGYDLTNFLAACAVKAPEGAAAYQAGQFSDGANVLADWAVALGLLPGGGGFSPSSNAAGETAAAMWAGAAALCGADAGTEGTAGGTYTVKQCLADALSFFTRTEKAAPLLSYEEEVGRVSSSFSQVELQRELVDFGSVFYGTQGGQRALAVVYREGGARNLTPPADGLSYISEMSPGIGLIHVYGSDGREYEVDAFSNTSVYVVSDDPMSITILPEGEPPATADRAQTNPYGSGPYQAETMRNLSAAPHVIGHSTMCAYSNDGGTWDLKAHDQVLLRVSAERAEMYPAGQSVIVGYLLNGKSVEASDAVLLENGTYRINIPEDGQYQFFLTNITVSNLYITSMTLQVIRSPGRQ